MHDNKHIPVRSSGARSSSGDDWTTSPREDAHYRVQEEETHCWRRRERRPVVESRRRMASMASPVPLLLLLVAVLAALVPVESAPPQPDFSTCVPYELPATIPHVIDGPVRNCCISALVEGPKQWIEWEQYILENPLPKQMRVRRAAHLVADNMTFLEQLNKAYRLSQQLPREDPRSNFNLDNFHCMMGGAILRQKGFPDKFYSVHQNWQFHPFHRWFTFFFERTLAKLVGDEMFALPFWNWDNQTPKETFLPNVVPWFYRRPDIFPNLFNPNRNARLDPGRPDEIVHISRDWNWEVLDGVVVATDKEWLRRNNNANIHRLTMLEGRDKFLSYPLRAGDQYKDGRETFENNVHSVPHFWVGDNKFNYEDMGAVYTSMRDPILFGHHSNVDRMWAVWQTLGLENFDNDPDFTDVEFFFWNENAELVRVTLKDCLNIHDLGYTYEEVENPWITYSATADSDSDSSHLYTSTQHERRRTWV